MTTITPLQMAGTTCIITLDAYAMPMCYARYNDSVLSIC
jgi:hypothetical protein